MATYNILFVVFLNFLFIQAKDHTGNVPPNPYSVLAHQPKTMTLKSLTPNCGCNHVLTFDDISNASNIPSNIIPNAYGGLNWINGWYLNTTWERVTHGWNGYATGQNSGIFVAFNGNGLQMAMSVPAGQYFQLNSVVLAAAWNNNLMLTIKATRANVLIYQAVVNLQVASKTTFYTLKWPGIDKITFDSTGGTPYPGLSGVGTQFVLDDVDISI